MEGGEAGADYADADFDLRPEHVAGVGPGWVGVVDIGDGPAADDGCGAGAFCWGGVVSLEVVCLGGDERMWGFRRLVKRHKKVIILVMNKLGKGGGRTRKKRRDWGRGTYNAPTRKIALRAIFRVFATWRFQTTMIGSNKTNQSNTVFGTLIFRSMWSRRQWDPGIVLSQLAAIGWHWNKVAKKTAIPHPQVMAIMAKTQYRNKSRTPKDAYRREEWTS